MSDVVNGARFFKDTVSIDQWLTGLIIILFMIVAIVTLVQKLVSILKKPVQKAKQDEQDHSAIIVTKQDLKKLKDKQQKDVQSSKKQREQIRKDLQELKDIVLDAEIERERTAIINFSATLNDHTRKDQFDYYFKMCERYENILKKRGLQNGQTKAAMDHISTAFSKRLEEGFKE